MILLGVIVNAAAIVIGGALGLLFSRGVPERLSRTLVQALGLCVLYVGIRGSLSGEKILVAILSIIIGALIGELLDLDALLKRLGDHLQSRLSKGKDSSLFGEAFINASLFVCVGAMAIVGSLQSGLNGNHEVLFSKALLDGVFALIMSSALGIGVCFAAVPLFIYQAALTLTAGFVSGYLTPAVISEINCVGSLLIVAIALNILDLTKIKVANLLPAPFLPILLSLFF